MCCKEPIYIGFRFFPWVGQATASTCGAAINGGEQPCMMWINSEKH